MSEPPYVIPAQVFLPEDQQVGVWAHGVGPSANANEIMLDFILQTGQVAVTDEDGREGVQPQFRVVSRVRLPPAQMFEIMKALSALLAEWEQRFGPVPRPGVVEAPLFPPDDIGNSTDPTDGDTP